MMVSTAEVAETLLVSRRRVVALIAAGRLAARRDGRAWLVDTDDIAKLGVRKAGRPRTVYRDDLWRACR